MGGTSLIDHRGLVSHLGSREECLSVPGTQYCIVPIQIKSLDKEGLHAMCLPKECAKSDVAIMVSTLSGVYRRTFTFMLADPSTAVPIELFTVDRSGAGVVCETQ